MIEINNVSKTIKGEIVLDNVSISMKKGYIYSFEGKNGSGKTMLFRAICGLITIDSGEILVNGKKIGPNSVGNNIGLLLENPSFLDGLTAYQNLKMIASIQNIVSDDRILEVISLVGLFDSKYKKYEAYSLGMKQRLAIANVIMEDPEILIFDEPTNAIDEEGIEVLKKIIKQEKDKGKTILISSHEKNFISELADYYFYMSKGRLTNKE